MSLADDDVESGDFQDVGENNFQRIRNKITKLGYADGVSDGKESVFQKGFDQGYKDGLRTGFEIDKFRHFFQNLNADQLTDSDLQTEKDKYEKLQTKESKSANHFQYLKHKDENLDIISQKQHQHIDEITEHFTQNMSKASSLLLPKQSKDCM